MYRKTYHRLHLNMKRFDIGDVFRREYIKLQKCVHLCILLVLPQTLYWSFVSYAAGWHPSFLATLHVCFCRCKCLKAFFFFSLFFFLPPLYVSGAVIDSHLNEETWARDDPLMLVIHSHEEMSPHKSYWRRGPAMWVFTRMDGVWKTQMCVGIMKRAPSCLKICGWNNNRPILDRKSCFRTFTGCSQLIKMK